MMTLRVIPTGDDARPAEKRNIGIREATGEIIAFLDDDTVPLQGWLHRAVAYFSDPAIGGVGGPATTPPCDPFWAQIGGRVYANPLVSGSYRRRYIPTRVCNEDDIPSCNLLVRADILRTLGGFDTTHWPGEDTLLCQAIVHQLRRELIYDPWVIVHHHRRALFNPHLRQIQRYARHRGAFARQFQKTSLRLAYFLPSLFLLHFAFVPIVCTIPTFFGLFTLSILLCNLYFVAIALYLLIVAVASFSTSPAVWGATFLGIILTHFVYGGGFLNGFLRPTKLPARTARFDHPSETKQ